MNRIFRALPCIIGWWLSRSSLVTIAIRPPSKKCDHPAVHFPLVESGLPYQIWCHMCGKVKIEKRGWVRPTIEIRKHLKTPISLPKGLEALFKKLDQKNTND